MITGASIRAGTGYLENHLVHADYYSENNKIEGEWMGLLCDDLGLNPDIDFKQAFSSLSGQIHPVTGESLTQAKRENAISFHDVNLSAPKDFSVLCELTQDDKEREELKELFKSEAREVFKELESYASVRDRKGLKRTSDDSLTVGKMAGAMFVHEHSRELDPQHHAHLVIANACRHPETNEWLSLDRAQMMKASKFIRQKFYDRLSDKLEQKGYKTHNHSKTGFDIQGMEHLRERFSRRRTAIEKGIEAYASEMGIDPKKVSKKQIEIITKETRDEKMKNHEPEALRKEILERVTIEEHENLKTINQHDYEPKVKMSADLAIERALEHLMERESVTDEFALFTEACELSKGRIEGDLKEALLKNKDAIIGENYQITSKEAVRQELNTIDKVNADLKAFPKLGNYEEYKDQIVEIRANYIASLTKDKLKEKNGEKLTENEISEIDRKADQSELLKAGEILLNSESRISVLIGDAGTGKTFGTSIMEENILKFGDGKKFIGIGPTGRARDQLAEDGIDGASTVAKFMGDKEAQAMARGRTIIVDEDGIVGMKDKNDLVNLLEELDARMILIGDAKQHEAVSRGNGLQMIMESCPDVPVARLGQVRRQENAKDRAISESMSRGNFKDAIDMQIECKQIEEIKNEEDLFQSASDYYVEKILEDEEVLTVCPTWKEIGMFSDKVRENLIEEGILKEKRVSKVATKSLSFTEAQKKTMSQYEEGFLLTFHLKTENVAKNETLKVVEVGDKSLMAENANGDLIKITSRQAKAFDVAEAKEIEIREGEKIMLKSNLPEVGSNGDILKVTSIEGDSIKALTKKNVEVTIPKDYKGLDYGYAVTSHKSQGASIKNSMLVMGESSLGMANKRQYYVSNTRHKETHKAFIKDVAVLRNNVERASLKVNYAHQVKDKRDVISEKKNPSIKQKKNPAIVYEKKSIPVLEHSKRIKKRHYIVKQYNRIRTHLMKQLEKVKKQTEQIKNKI